MLGIYYFGWYEQEVDTYNNDGFMYFNFSPV